MEEELFELLLALLKIGLSFDIVSIEAPDFDGGVPGGQQSPVAIPVDGLDLLTLLIGLFLELVFWVFLELMIKHNNMNINSS